MLASLELEIKYLLTQEESLEKVIDLVIKTVEQEADAMTTDHIETLCRFLLNAQAGRALVAFVHKHWDESYFTIPWPYYLIALDQVMNDELAEILWEGIIETKSQQEASRCLVLDSFYPEIKEVRQARKEKAASDFEFQKRELLDNLNTLRVQQLYEQEKKLLARLLRMYPHDQEILRESADFKERSALEVINRLAPLRKTSIIDPDLNDSDLQKAKDSWAKTFLEAAATTPELRYDFAVASFMMGLDETALKILDMTEDGMARSWFRLELLLRVRRFLDLLHELAEIEVAYSHDPETFFATTYLRAQALWGLGQKHLAIEAMESILAARPQYRMGASLLALWRTQ